MNFISQTTDRLCVKDYQLELDDGRKFTIEKGMTLTIPIYAYHRDPEYFPNPEKFDPERFSAENRHNVDPDNYIPFGRIFKYLFQMVT